MLVKRHVREVMQCLMVSLIWYSKLEVTQCRWKKRSWEGQVAVVVSPLMQVHRSVDMLAEGSKWGFIQAPFAALRYSIKRVFNP